MRRVVGVFAAVALVVGACGLGLVGTAAAGSADGAPSLTVQKVVSGTSTSGFTVQVSCLLSTVMGENPNTTLTFTAAGAPATSTNPDWASSAGAWRLHDGSLVGARCTVSESANGGATSTSFTCAYNEFSNSMNDAPPVPTLGCPGAASGPSSTPATVTFQAPDGTSGQSALVTVTNTFPVITAVTQDANSVLVTGSGFPANTEVTVDIQSTPLVLGKLTADANGAFSKRFAIPCSVGAGGHTVTATAATGPKASTAVTLAACPVVAAITFTG